MAANSPCDEDDLVNEDHKSNVHSPTEVATNADKLQKKTTAGNNNEPEEDTVSVDANLKEMSDMLRKCRQAAEQRKHNEHEADLSSDLENNFQETNEQLKKVRSEYRQRQRKEQIKNVANQKKLMVTLYPKGNTVQTMVSNIPRSPNKNQVKNPPVTETSEQLQFGTSATEMEDKNASKDNVSAPEVAEVDYGANESDKSSEIDYFTAEKDGFLSVMDRCTHWQDSDEASSIDQNSKGDVYSSHSSENEDDHWDDFSSAESEDEQYEDEHEDHEKPEDGDEQWIGEKLNENCEISKDDQSPQTCGTFTENHDDVKKELSKELLEEEDTTTNHNLQIDSNSQRNSEESEDETDHQSLETDSMLIEETIKNSLDECISEIKSLLEHLDKCELSKADSDQSKDNLLSNRNKNNDSKSDDHGETDCSLLTDSLPPEKKALVEYVREVKALTEHLRKYTQSDAYQTDSMPAENPVENAALNDDHASYEQVLASMTHLKNVVQNLNKKVSKASTMLTAAEKTASQIKKTMQSKAGNGLYTMKNVMQAGKIVVDTANNVTKFAKDTLTDGLSASASLDTHLQSSALVTTLQSTSSSVKVGHAQVNARGSLKASAEFNNTKVSVDAELSASAEVVGLDAKFGDEQEKDCKKHLSTDKSMKKEYSASFKGRAAVSAKGGSIKVNTTSKDKISKAPDVNIEAAAVAEATGINLEIMSKKQRTDPNQEEKEANTQSEVDIQATASASVKGLDAKIGNAMTTELSAKSMGLGVHVHAEATGGEVLVGNKIEKPKFTGARATAKAKATGAALRAGNYYKSEGEKGLSASAEANTSGAELNAGNISVDKGSGTGVKAMAELKPSLTAGNIHAGIGGQTGIRFSTDVQVGNIGVNLEPPSLNFSPFSPFNLAFGGGLGGSSSTSTKGGGSNSSGGDGNPGDDGGNNTNTGMDALNSNTTQDCSSMASGLGSTGAYTAGGNGNITNNSGNSGSNSSVSQDCSNMASGLGSGGTYTGNGNGNITSKSGNLGSNSSASQDFSNMASGLGSMGSYNGSGNGSITNNSSLLQSNTRSITSAVDDGEIENDDCSCTTSLNANVSNSTSQSYSNTSTMNSTSEGNNEGSSGITSESTTQGLQNFSAGLSSAHGHLQVGVNVHQQNSASIANQPNQNSSTTGSSTAGNINISSSTSDEDNSFCDSNGIHQSSGGIPFMAGSSVNVASTSDGLSIHRLSCAKNSDKNLSTSSFSGQEQLTAMHFPQNQLHVHSSGSHSQAVTSAVSGIENSCVVGKVNSQDDVASRHTHKCAEAKEVCTLTTLRSPSSKDSHAAASVDIGAGSKQSPHIISRKGHSKHNEKEAQATSHNHVHSSNDHETASFSDKQHSYDPERGTVNASKHHHKHTRIRNSRTVSQNHHLQPDSSNGSHVEGHQTVPGVEITQVGSTNEIHHKYTNAQMQTASDCQLHSSSKDGCDSAMADRGIVHDKLAVGETAIRHHHHKRTKAKGARKQRISPNLSSSGNRSKLTSDVHGQIVVYNGVTQAVGNGLHHCKCSIKENNGDHMLPIVQSNQPSHGSDSIITWDPCGSKKHSTHAAMKEQTAVLHYTDRDKCAGNTATRQHKIVVDMEGTWTVSTSKHHCKHTKEEKHNKQTTSLNFSELNVGTGAAAAFNEDHQVVADEAVIHASKKHCKSAKVKGIRTHHCSINDKTPIQVSKSHHTFHTETTSQTSSGKDNHATTAFASNSKKHGSKVISKDAHTKAKDTCVQTISSSHVAAAMHAHCATAGQDQIAVAGMAVKKDLEKHGKHKQIKEIQTQAPKALQVGVHFSGEDQGKDSHDASIATKKYHHDQSVAGNVDIPDIRAKESLHQCTKLKEMHTQTVQKISSGVASHVVTDCHYSHHNSESHCKHHKELKEIQTQTDSKKDLNSTGKNGHFTDSVCDMQHTHDLNVGKVVTQSVVTSESHPIVKTNTKVKVQTTPQTSGAGILSSNIAVTDNRIKTVHGETHSPVSNKEAMQVSSTSKHHRIPRKLNEGHAQPEFQTSSVLQHHASGGGNNFSIPVGACNDHTNALDSVSDHDMLQGVYQALSLAFPETNQVGGTALPSHQKPSLHELKEKIAKVTDQLEKEEAANNSLKSGQRSQGSKTLSSSNGSYTSKDDGDIEEVAIREEKKKPIGTNQNIHTMDSIRESTYKVQASKKPLRMIGGNVVGFQ